jgi:hypothetical protein
VRERRARKVAKTGTSGMAPCPSSRKSRADPSPGEVFEAPFPGLPECHAGSTSLRSIFLNHAMSNIRMVPR